MTADHLSVGSFSNSTAISPACIADHVQTLMKVVMSKFFIKLLMYYAR